MITVEIQIDINHPADKTFQFIANPENNPKWQGGMKHCKITSEGALGLGSQYEQQAEFMGKKIITLFEITEFEKDHLIKGESIKSSFPITFKRIVTGDESHSKVKAIVTGDPSGFFKIFPFFTKWMISSSIKRDYKNLKQLLEM